MTQPSTLDRVGLDLDGVSAEQRSDMWADLVRPIFDVSALNPAEMPIERVDAWLLDNLMLTRVAFGSHVFDRKPKHVKADIADCLLVELYLSGGLKGDMDGQEFRIEPGDLHIVDFSRPFTSRATSAKLVSFLVSHDAVGYDRSRHPPTMAIRRDSVFGRIMRDAVVNIFRQIDTITKAEQSAVAGGLVGLLRGAFHAPTSQSVRPAFAAARGQAIRDFIAQNLRSENLTADAICGEFGLSRATLYREFEADGGLKHYITSRRLNAALTSLAFADTPRGAVSRAAETWGFSSTSHFSREFRRMFGFGPGSIVGTQPRPAPTGDGQSTPGAPAGSVLLPLLRKL